MNVTNELYTTLGNVNYDSLILGKGLQMLAACSQIKWTLKSPVAKPNFRYFYNISRGKYFKSCNSSSLLDCLL